MPYAFIGVGQCGGSIVDATFSDKRMFEVAVPIAINSATADLQILKNLGREYWIGISRDRGFIDGLTEGFEHFVSGGYGKNREKAEEDALKHEDTIRDMIIEKARIKVSDEEGTGIPVAFIAYALGGGTGSGAAPIIAKVLKEMNIPVIAIAVLPASHEGGLTAKNAVESLNRLTKHVDSVILIDNERLAQLESPESFYQSYNEYVATCLRDIVLGTALEKINPAEFEAYAPVIDLKDVISASSFRFEKKQLPGFACLGRAAERTRSLLRYIFPIRGFKEIDVISLLYRSFMKLTVAEIKVEEAEKNLVLLRLQPEYLTKKGKINTVMAKKIMEERSRLKETHFGVALTNRNIASVTVMLTYRPTQIYRLHILSELARQYKDISLKVLEEYEELMV